MQLDKTLATASLVLIIVVAVEAYFYLMHKQLPAQKVISQVIPQTNSTPEETPYHTSLNSFVTSASAYIENSQSFKKSMYTVMRYSGTITTIQKDTQSKTATIVLSDASGDIVGEYRAFPFSILKVYQTSPSSEQLLSVDSLQKGSIVDVREYSSVYAPGKPNELFIELHLLNEAKK